MTTEFPPAFARQYESHLKHLKLKGLQPKTIDAYSRAIRRLGGYFDYRIDALSEAQLTEYFSDLIGTHSWSAVKLDLYGLKFFTQHVLKQPWATVQSFCLKGLIALLHLVLRITPLSAPPTEKPRPGFLCPCCGKPMQVIRRRIVPSGVRRRNTEAATGTAV